MDGTGPKARSAAAAEARGAVPDVPDAQGVRACPASTDGAQRAPFAPGDDVERVTRVLRIEGLAAASASTFSRGSLSLDQLPPPPSSARTARSYLPITHGVEHDEAARRAPRGRRARGHGGRRAARPTSACLWRLLSGCFRPLSTTSYSTSEFMR